MTANAPAEKVETSLSKYPSIVKFLDENKEHFTFAVGEIGFGRPCLGISQRGSDHWVGYAITSDDENYTRIAECKAAYGKDRPKDAYHKDDYLAVLIHDVDEHFGPSDAQKAEAAAALDKWLGGIIEAGYKVQEYPESKHSIGAVFGGKRRTLLAVVDK